LNQKEDASYLDGDKTIHLIGDENEVLWKKRIDQKVKEIVDEKIAFLSSGGKQNK
jgi:hypothetical protein